MYVHSVFQWLHQLALSEAVDQSQIRSSCYILTTFFNVTWEDALTQAIARGCGWSAMAPVISDMHV